MAIQPHFFERIAYLKSKHFAQQLKIILDQNRVVHLQDLPTGLDLMEFYQQLNQELGHLIKRGEDLEQQTGFTKDQWLDVRYDPALSHTFRHSNTRQPLHTDGAYITDFDFEVVFLFCTQQAEAGGETIFINADDIVDELKRHEPGLLDELLQTPVVFGKGNFGTKTTKIIEKVSDGFLLNWNYYRVATSNTEEVQQMAERFHQFLETHFFAPGRYTAVQLKVGECVYFYDRQVLHGRTAFTGNRCLIKGALNLVSN